MRRLCLDLFKQESKNSNQLKGKLQQEIDSYKERISKARKLLIDEVISAKDFQEAKAEYEPIIAKLEAQKEEAGSFDSQYKLYVEYGFSVLRNIDQYYDDADIEAKQKLIGWIFPEKNHF